MDISNSGQTPRLGLHPGSYTNATLRAKLYLPELLRGLKLTRAAAANLSGTKRQPSTELRLSGASKLSGSLLATQVRLSVAEASTASLIGNAGDLSLEACGAKAHLADLAVGRARVDMR